jgi:predicted permease
VAFVSPSFFDTLGTSAVAGRLLRAGDADASAPPAALISERLWRRVFHGSPAVLQTSLTIAGRAFPLVGVTPERFSGLRIIDLGAADSEYPDAWICLRDASLWRATAHPSFPWLAVAGRLAPGATLNAARAELSVVATRLAPPGAGGAQRHRAFRVYRAGLDWRDEPTQSLLVLGMFLAIPLCVLAIGCVNVINLQLARAMDEGGELSLRLALGASRWRIVRLLLVEVAVVAAVSTVIGCVGARVLLMRAAAASPVPPAVDPAAMAFAALLVTAVVCVAGLLPAWWSSRDVVAAGLRDLRDASKMRVRFRRFLIVVQVAASVALLALSGVAIRSLTTGAAAGSSAAREILTAAFDFGSASANRSTQFVRAMENRLGDATAIRGVAFATFGAIPRAVRYQRPADAPGQERIAAGGYVTPQWFAVADARFVAGDARGDFPPGSAVVNRTLASVLSGTGAAGGRADAAIGARIRVGRTDAEIVGVIEDMPVGGGDGTPVPILILPMSPTAPDVVAILVRANDGAGARQAMAAAVTAIDPTLPVPRIQTFDDQIAEASRGLRDLVSMAATLGGLSVALAGAGLHSLLAYAVRRRRREIGIRVALGAQSREVVGMAVAPAVWLVVAGAVAGLALAMPVALVIRASLPGVSPLDLRGLLPSVAILMLVAVVGAAGPTFQAIRVQPIDALRE